MARVYYNKLVRDKIREKIEKKGEHTEIWVIEDDAEFQQELLKKVHEEAAALSKVRSREEFLNEYADLMVVLDALTDILGFSEADIRTALAENLGRKGAFKERHFMHWSDDIDYKSNETPQGVKQA